MASQYTLYTDGSCLVNPGGAGGYGAVLIDMTTGEVTEKSEGFYASTNNRMEVMAAIEGLKMVPVGASVELVADSQYLVKTIDGYFTKKKNHDLWRQLDAAMAGKKVHTTWVRGHKGNPYNERCDQMAMQAANNPSRQDTGYEEPATEDLSFFMAAMPAQPPATPKPAPAAKTLKPVTATPKPAVSDVIPPWKRVSAPNGAEYYTGPERDVRDSCKNAIIRLNRADGLKFKDFASLRTGGVDGWSTLYDAAEVFGMETSADLLTVLPSRRDVATCARWYGRGLRFELCIRKVLTDLEVSANARKAG